MKDFSDRLYETCTPPEEKQRDKIGGKMSWLFMINSKFKINLIRSGLGAVLMTIGGGEFFGVVAMEERIRIDLTGMSSDFSFYNVENDLPPESILDTFFDVTSTDLVSLAKKYTKLYNEGKKISSLMCLDEVEKLSMINGLIFRAKNKKFFEYFRTIFQDYVIISNFLTSETAEEDLKEWSHHMMIQYIEEKRNFACSLSTSDCQHQSLQIILMDLTRYKDRMDENYEDMDSKSPSLIQATAEMINKMSEFSHKYTQFFVIMLQEREELWTILNALWKKVLLHDCHLSRESYPHLYTLYDEKAKKARQENLSPIPNTHTTTLEEGNPTTSPPPQRKRFSKSFRISASRSKSDKESSEAHLSPKTREKRNLSVSEGIKQTSQESSSSVQESSSPKSSSSSHFRLNKVFSWPGSSRDSSIRSSHNEDDQAHPEG